MTPNPTLILRHRRENLKKCSLRGLESRSDIEFYTYPKDTLPSLKGYLLLTINAEVLTAKDRELSLFLIDGSWKHAEVMYRQLERPALFVERSLPSSLQTAYPRRQEDCEDPSRGLASIEALFTAFFILGKNRSGLLDNYYWKEQFLQKNKDFFF